MGRPAFSIRPLQLPRDGPALDRLDGSMTTDAIYDVAPSAAGFTLTLRPVPPLARAFTVDDWQEADRLWDRGWVAEQAGGVAGVLCARWEGWNRRLSVWHLYVDRAHRGRGLARALMAAAADEGRRLGARTLWLETQNVNVPAVRAYRAMGFSLAGLDTTLYRGTDREEDVALFLYRALP